MTHGYTTTYTNDPISPVKAAQTEIAPVLLCVSQQCYSTVFISDTFNEECTDSVQHTEGWTQKQITAFMLQPVGIWCFVCIQR